MRKDEYLNILSDRLRVLPLEEYNDIMEYYKEYFEDAGVENEEKVINELGDVEELAKKIINENMPISNIQNGMYIERDIPYGQNSQPYNEYKQTSQGLSTGWKVAITILTFPIWIGIVGAIFGLIAGITCIVVGCMTIGASVATCILLVGGGLISIAISLGFLMATVGIIQLLAKLFKMIFGKKAEVTLEKKCIL